MSPDIVVVGSLNQDLTVRVPRHPAPGETVLGTGHFAGPGGKGANQAVAAARLGRSVAMVGRVGDDPGGHGLRESLALAGVDTSMVTVDPDAETGVAVITLDERGENTIVVSPGANRLLGISDIDAAGALLESAAVTLLQLEVPIAIVERAAALAGGTVILNPAPAHALPATLLERVDLLVPNRSELAVLVGAAEPESVAQAAEQAMRLPGAVIVTMGADGALLVAGGEVERVAAPSIVPVDTTAAGDAFCGALADALCRDTDVPAAVQWAVHAGAVAATRRGALASLPDADDVRASLTGGSR